MRPRKSIGVSLPKHDFVREPEPLFGIMLQGFDRARGRERMTLTISAPLRRERVVAGLRPPSTYRRARGTRGKYGPVLRRDRSRAAIKRLFDILSASLALLFFAPLLAGIAIAIKMNSPGPVFFRQPRYGKGNRLFRIYKFRTMYTHLNDASGVRQTTSNDARVTSVGRVLRQTSLDELPQLINVVKGHMSLVGPRPHVPGMFAGGVPYEDLVPYYFQRHMVRPGITGLAQVNGCRGSTARSPAAIARIDHDLDYIENWSLSLDVKIIARTVVTEFLSGTGI
jgi:lipopolysaccharide/colanic/teichoic acid biosynthesis glycosyltransferase